MSSPRSRPTPSAPAARTAGRRNRRHGAPAFRRIELKQRLADASRGRTRCRVSRSTQADVYLAGRRGTTRLIAVRGEMDLATAEGLYQCLKELAGPPPQQITLDLSQVGFIDCAGLHALDGMARLVHGNGGSMRIGATSPAAARLFHLADWPGWR